MRANNPLLGEALRGIASAGRAQNAYLKYLALQAAVLLVWWPKGGLTHALALEDAPDTLLAVVIIVGLTVAYYNMRAGAEEFLLPGQQPLRDWVLATPLPLGRILAGYVAGQLAHTLHLLALSAPLLLAAFSVAGGEWPALAWCLVAVVFQATFYRLAGGVIYVQIGHRGELAFFSVRAVVLGLYAFAAIRVPVASHPRLAHGLLERETSTGAAGTAAGASPLAFMMLYTMLGAVLACVLYAQLRRERARSSRAAA